MNGSDGVKIRPALLIAAAFLIAASAPQTLRSGQVWRPSAPISSPGANGAVRLSGQVAGVTIGPATVTKAYRAVESEEGSTLERSVITGLTGRDLERDGIRLRQASDVVIRDFDLAMRAEPQTGKHLPEGIAIYAGHNLVIRDGRVRGFRKVVEEGHYTNGDGIATEGAVDGLVIERVTSSDNSDGGFDLKGKNIRLDALIAERNSRNFRFWGDVRAGTLTANGWTSAAVWVGKGATVRIATLTANNDTPAPLLIVETGGSIEIGQCHLKLPAGTSIVKRGGGRNHIVLGPGCGHAGG